MTCEMAYLEEQRNNRYSAMVAQISGLQARIAELEAQLSSCVVGPWRKQTDEDKDGRPLLVKYEERGETKYQIARYLECAVEGIGTRWVFNEVFHMIDDDYQFIAVADIRDKSIAEWPESAITEMRHRLGEVHRRYDIQHFHISALESRIAATAAGEWLFPNSDVPDNATVIGDFGGHVEIINKLEGKWAIIQHDYVAHVSPRRIAVINTEG